MRNNDEIMNDIREIEKFDDYEGLLGFSVIESVNEKDNSYSDVGSHLLSLIERKPECADIIEETVIAITGWSFESLIRQMRSNKDYYSSL